MSSLSLAGAVPLAVVLTTLPTWLADRGITASEIGLFGLAGLPWSLKFLWSPLIDRFRPPFGGRRRGWVMLAQLALLFAIAVVPWVDPNNAPVVIAAGFAIALFSASQDIAMDAYAVELMRKHEQGPGNALRTTFYRIGMLAAGGAAVAAAGLFSWKLVFLGVGLVMLPSMLLTGLAPEPDGVPAPIPTLRDAVIEPLKQFFSRKGAIAIALFVFLYKLGDNMAHTMLSPFFVQGLKVPLVEIGFAQKTVGMAATIIGTLLGGALIPRLGLGRALWLFGFAQAAANVTYALTAWSDGFRPIMYTAIALEYGCGGMGTAALLTLITRVCDKRLAATQFALLTSLFGLGRSLAGPPSGFLTEQLGYAAFFLLTVAAAMPAMFVLYRIVPPTAREPELA